MSDTAATGPVLAADGTPLKRSLARALRVQKTRALMLIAPLLLFVMITFIIPIGSMLFRSVENGIVEETLPNTIPLLVHWDASTGDLPGEEIYAAMARDMVVAVEAKNHTKLGTRLNYEQTGISSLFRKSGRAMKKLGSGCGCPVQGQVHRRARRLGRIGYLESHPDPCTQCHTRIFPERH